VLILVAKVLFVVAELLIAVAAAPLVVAELLAPQA